MTSKIVLGAPEPIAALNRIPITEYALPLPTRESLVDIRLTCPNVVLSEHVCPYLRVRVAEMLNRAQDSLPAGYRLKVGTALRTLSMQRSGWDGSFKRNQEAHPDWPLSALRRATNKYHAPYDQKAPPGHCTGAAADVGLLDPDGAELDMIAPTEGWQAAATWSDKIGPEAKRNRMLMVEAMLGAGFSNCRDEYWHYSWGDSAWAVRHGEKECPYGWAHPPVRLETDFPEARAANLAMNTTTDANGRAVHAEGSCVIPPDSDRLRVGLYWAKGVPVTLRLPAEISASPPLSAPVFYLGDNKEKWEPISTVQRGDENGVLELTPDADRVYLTNYLPEAPPDAS